MRSRLRTAGRERSPGARWPALLGGIGLGSALFYFIDPVLGRARRVRARDQAARMARLRTREVLRVEHDLSNRAHGLLARARAALRVEAAPDEVIRERVRSIIGRVCSHAGAVEVTVRDGQVLLCGPVLEREHGRVIREVGRVRGVRAIENQLVRHLHPTNVPGLQESRRRSFVSEMRAPRAADVMKREVQLVTPDDTVHRAAELMMLANVGFLPVCDRERNVVGTVTDRDIVVRAVANGLSLSTCRVGDVMTRQVVACHPDDELTLAERLMGQRQISRMVIIDDNGKLAGVISLSDVAEHEPARRAARTLRAVAAREAPRP
jgi:CBS domain-containing protein